MELDECRVPVLWRDGDPWRDLTTEADAAGIATVISESGTARFVDFERRQYIREPLEGGKVILGDWEWMPFNSAEITPCGVVLDDPWFWARGTRLRLVFGGLVDDWMSTVPGRDAVTSTIHRTPPVSPGHPSEPCRAWYCTARPT